MSTTWGPTAISANDDDCMIYSGPAQLWWYAGVSFGAHATQGPKDAGFRWLNLTIPKNASIVSAKVTLRGSGDTAGTTVNATIVGQASASPAIFHNVGGNPNGANDFLGRTRTTATVAWNGVGSWTNTTEYDTPDITTVIQEIVNLSAWASGSNLALFIEDNGSTAGANREAFCRDDYAPYAPKLTIVYNDPPAGNPHYAYAQQQ